jgi:hypothetical protein
VRILDLGEHPLPAELSDSDWWQFDWWLVGSADGGQRVLCMTYESDGQFRDAWFADEGEDADRSVPGFVAIRSHLWACAEPFASWWNRHTELHRDGSRAA